MSSRRPRLPAYSYQGARQWFVTIRCHGSLPLLDCDALMAMVCEQFLRAAHKTSCEVLAYCVMPDHVHVLLRGSDPAADLRSYVRQAKQLTGFAYRRSRGGYLWQRSYHDRVLRRHTPLSDVIGYILHNPVRAGLVDYADEYEFAGVSESLDEQTRIAIGIETYL